MWLHEHKWLTLLQRCLIAEVCQLTSDGKDCYASNQYFADIFCCSPGHIANTISEIQGLYLTVTSTGNRRTIRVIDSLPDETELHIAMKQIRSKKAAKKTTASPTDDAPLHPQMNVASPTDDDNTLSSNNVKVEVISPPAVGGPPTPKKPTDSLKEKKKKKEDGGRAGAENEPKELATIFDLARKDLLKVSGMDWGQAKEHSNLKKLVAALGRKAPPKDGEYDLARKKQYLRRFLQIASEDKFVRENFTPSILYSMMNKIFTTYELKKKEAESKPKIEDMPYHKKFNHEPSGMAIQLAAKKSV